MKKLVTLFALLPAIAWATLNITTLKGLPFPIQHLFVYPNSGTSALTGSLGVGGIYTADYLCQSHAPAGTWKAILSSDSVSAASRIDFTGGPIFSGSTGGSLITASYSQIFGGGSLTNSINASALHVWTGSDTMGVSTSGDTCSNWSTTSGSGSAGTANSTSSGGWMNNGTLDPCSTTVNNLYCINHQTVGAPPAIATFSAVSCDSSTITYSFSAASSGVDAAYFNMGLFSGTCTSATTNYGPILTSTFQTGTRGTDGVPFNAFLCAANSLGAIGTPTTLGATCSACSDSTHSVATCASCTLATSVACLTACSDASLPTTASGGCVGGGCTLGSSVACQSACGDSTKPRYLIDSCHNCTLGNSVQCNVCDDATSTIYANSCASCTLGTSVQCAASCGDATKPNYGDSCASCTLATSVQCAANCNDSTKPVYGASCASCTLGSSVQCAGACADATTPQYGGSCASCTLGTSVQCASACADSSTPQYGGSCASCTTGTSVSCVGCTVGSLQYGNTCTGCGDGTTSYTTCQSCTLNTSAQCGSACADSTTPVYGASCASCTLGTSAQCVAACGDSTTPQYGQSCQSCTQGTSVTCTACDIGSVQYGQSCVNCLAGGTADQCSDCPLGLCI